MVLARCIYSGIGKISFFVRSGHNPGAGFGTMISEAFHGSPQFNGMLLVVGFVALLILLALSH
jgi:hypothetical protein